MNRYRSLLPTCKASLARRTTLALAVALALPGRAFAGAPSEPCCADLEDRVAELEQSVVRKGNRRVSLIISGQVTRSILTFDDSVKRDNYFVDGPSGSRFRLEGSAKVSPEITAGYYLEFSAGTNPIGRVDQKQANVDRMPEHRQSIVFLRHARLGAVTLGYGQTATGDSLGANLGGQGVVASSNVMTTGGNMVTRSSDGGLNFANGSDNISLRWRRLANDLGSDDRHMIRYDSPSLAGFVVQAARGDAFWDANLRFARTTKDVAVTAQLGFSRDTLQKDSGAGTIDVRDLQASASIWHMPTGLFLSGAYQWRQFGGTDEGMVNSACGSGTDAGRLRTAGVACANRPDFDYVWASAGLRRKWWDVGFTSIYGEYATGQNGVAGLSVGITTARGGDVDFVTDSRVQVLGAGIVQTIDAAAMDLFIAARHYRADIQGLEASGTPASVRIEPMNVLVTGMRIRF